MEHGKTFSGMQSMSYSMFMVMLLISFFIMYIVMFLNMDKLSHYHISTTRTYMAMLMVAPMAVVMMLMTGKIYPGKNEHGYYFNSGGFFILVLTGLRTQTPGGDVQYMKAMIPHHSSAILVGKHANIQDPEVKKLS